MLVFFTGKETGHPEKNSSEQSETQQQTPTTYDTGPESKLGGAKFVVCERSSHCAISAPCIDIDSKLSNYLSANLLVETSCDLHSRCLNSCLKLCYLQILVMKTFIWIRSLCRTPLTDFFWQV